MRQRFNGKLVGSTLAATALFGAYFFTAAPASASVSATATTAGVSGTVSIMANTCNYPTSARPGSTYVSSYGNCYQCRAAELLQQNNFWWRDYYCTYNPSNNKNDLHYQ
jgi:hypothetical protein